MVFASPQAFRVRLRQKISFSASLSVIPMFYVNRITFLFQNLSDFDPQGNRTMLPACATNPYGEMGLALFDIVWQQKFQQIGKFLQKFLTFRLVDVYYRKDDGFGIKTCVGDP